jgi:hypothetical protein
MLNSNSDGFTSPYASQQVNPWANPIPLQGSPALPAWQQAALQQSLTMQTVIGVMIFHRKRVER